MNIGQRIGEKMKFKVTMDLWRESFNGCDYFDQQVIKIVNARNADFAKKKAEALIKKEFKNRSQSVWIKNSKTVIEEVN